MCIHIYTHMTSKNISITEEVYNKLMKIKQENESFSELFLRLLRVQKINFEKSFGAWNLNEKESKDFTLGIMTWFDEKKGINYLLDAMLVIKKKGYDHIKLILAGDGTLKKEILKFVINNDISNMISYIGKVKREDKENFFRSIDAFVLPSISLKNDQDGIPVVLMEAIAYSLPLISTDVSGIPEICITDFNGQLIPERNVDELVNAILDLHDHKGKRKEYAKIHIPLVRIMTLF